MKIFTYTKRMLVIPAFLVILLSSCEHKGMQSETHDRMEKGIMLNDAQMQLANITVAEATTGSLGSQLLLTGVLKIDEQSVVSITAGINGRIEKLYHKTTGEIVNVGDPLYEFYSEDLLALQRELKSLEDNNWNFVNKLDQTSSLENKLQLLGMLPSQITALKKSRYAQPVVTIYSSFHGIIKSVDATEGQYVTTGQQIYGMADDTKIWAEAQVYPNELQYLSVGIPAEVIIPAAGDLRIRNKISFINPAFEPGSNVTLVRVIVNNPGGTLRPGMHALIGIQTQKEKGIVIPASAVLIDKKGSLIWVQNEDGTFSSRQVTTGIQSADSVLITSGLSESEQYVVSGVYLLNSEKILNKGSDISME